MNATCTYFWGILTALVVAVITSSFVFIVHFDFYLFLLLPAWHPDFLPGTTPQLGVGMSLFPLNCFLVGLAFRCPDPARLCWDVTHARPVQSSLPGIFG